MSTIAYCSPFIPPEWIAAHGMQPEWLWRRTADDGHSLLGAGRSICPFAAEMIDEMLRGTPFSAIVLTTTCDQMRYSAALLESRGELPVFLMHVPATWQTDAAHRLYEDELRRLGRFLVRLGGDVSSPDELTRVMLDYQASRTTLQESQSRLSGRRFAELLVAVRSQGRINAEVCQAVTLPRGIPLAFVGGPLRETDLVVFDRIEQAGGRVALDATEGGERTLPARFDTQKIHEAPLRELARAYFGSIPDVTRRPNDGFFDWLQREVAERKVRGILFRRYVWCDLWHAEFQRAKAQSRVPMLEVDVSDDALAFDQTCGRIEAFLEMLT